MEIAYMFILATMNQLSATILHSKCFSLFLNAGFLHANNPSLTGIWPFLTNKLDDAQNTGMYHIFGGSSWFSVKVMLYLTRLPSMQERVQSLQSQFLLHPFTLPDDTLLSRLLCYIC